MLELLRNSTAKFWALMEKSIITQSVITIAFVATLCYLAIVGRTPPEYLVTFSGLAIGYYFGSKNSYTAAAQGR